MDDAVSLAALGIVATVCGAMVWLLKVLFKQNNGTLKDVGVSNALLAASIQKLAAAGDKQTEAIERQEIATDKWQKYVTKRFDRLETIGEDITNHLTGGK